MSWVERRHPVRRPLDLGLTTVPLRMSRIDPTGGFDGEFRKAMWTPEGPTSVVFRSLGNHIEVRAWGPGADWIQHRAPGMVGLTDDSTDFTPTGVVARIAERVPGVRLTRAPVLFDVVVQFVLQQRVTYGEAVRAYRGLVHLQNEPAPGPHGLLLPPSPETLVRISDADYMRFGVERRRASTLRSLAGSIRFLDRLSDTTEVSRRLSTLAGIGPWTVAMVRGVALADPDAVPMGDVNLPHRVRWVFERIPRGSDERMLELLEPFRGNRWRAIRLVLASGDHVPRMRRRRPRVWP